MKEVIETVEYRGSSIEIMYDNTYEYDAEVFSDIMVFSPYQVFSDYRGEFEDAWARFDEDPSTMMRYMRIFHTDTHVMFPLYGYNHSSTTYYVGAANTTPEPRRGYTGFDTSRLGYICMELNQWCPTIEDAQRQVEAQMSEYSDVVNGMIYCFDITEGDDAPYQLQHDAQGYGYVGDWEHAIIEAKQTIDYYADKAAQDVQSAELGGQYII